jgi:uncharacterized membrane protein YgdD (TMEM256/DUF423 family)
MNSSKMWIAIAALLGCTSVALGAFGAHLLPGFLERQNLPPEVVLRRLGNWETAAKYQMYHALALLAIAWLVTESRPVAASLAGWLFIAGVIVFSGCLYLLVLTGKGFLGAIVPLGGVLLIVGWFVLGVSALFGAKA